MNIFLIERFVQVAFGGNKLWNFFLSLRRKVAAEEQNIGKIIIQFFCKTELKIGSVVIYKSTFKFGERKFNQNIPERK